MRNNSHNLTFFIKVKGRVVDEYKHHGKTYIEGRKGSDYTLEFYNGTAIRRKIVVSVDGLNITTGDANWISGYVVDPYGTISIPGWKINSAKAAKFEFNSVPKSYNQHNDSGDKANVGVIGCLVFDEIPAPVKIVNNYIPVYDYYHPRPRPYRDYYWGYHYWDNPAYQGCGWGGAAGGSAGGASQFTTLNDGHTVSNLVGGGGSFSGLVGSATCGLGAATPAVSSVNFVETKSIAMSETLRSQPRGIAPLCSPDPEPVLQSIGTKWGEETQFNTTEVNLDWKKTSSCQMLIFYDSRKGLENRGVNFHHKHKHHAEPNAFPGLKQGCPYPR